MGFKGYLYNFDFSSLQGIYKIYTLKRRRIEIRKQPSASTNPATHQPGNELT